MVAFPTRSALHDLIGDSDADTFDVIEYVIPLSDWLRDMTSPFCSRRCILSAVWLTMQTMATLMLTLRL